jgi:hypothetical protein
MMPGDLLHVGMLDDGTWPNENAWMKGTNQTSRLTGDFPGGSYSVLIDEVNPQPPVQEKAPTPPPRRARGVSPRVDNDQHRGGAVVSPTRKRSHDVFKVTLHLPVLCVVCKYNFSLSLSFLPSCSLPLCHYIHLPYPGGDYVWGSACTGYKCQCRFQCFVLKLFFVYVKIETLIKFVTFSPFIFPSLSLSLSFSPSLSPSLYSLFISVP